MEFKTIKEYLNEDVAVAGAVPGMGDVSFTSGDSNGSGDSFGTLAAKKLFFSDELVGDNKDGIYNGTLSGWRFYNDDIDVKTKNSGVKGRFTCQAIIKNNTIKCYK